MPAERSMNWKSELVEAIIDGDMMLVRSLLSSGADINQMSLLLWTQGATTTDRYPLCTTGHCQSSPDTWGRRKPSKQPRPRSVGPCGGEELLHTDE
ncbi:hypothetical protein LSH36_215g03013 [Paralvinella palmiformis]|uniref:Uncharacterized protein n=1 Tax=Paralvinella palmiformis TaxID=53620 RepID=A0AAD9N4G1_9ANNE|nr:hypothetical protein LSH36_215g03013 [Paralvinella palmiformis]